MSATDKVALRAAVQNRLKHLGAKLVSVLPAALAKRVALATAIKITY